MTGEGVSHTLVFASVAAGGWLLAVAIAAAFRGRFFAVFAGVILGLVALSSVGLYRALPGLEPAFFYLSVVTSVHFVSLSFAALRPLPYRLLVSIPASFFAAGALLGFPWAILAGFGFEPFGAFIPFVLAGIGILESLISRESVRDLVVDGAPAGSEPARHRVPDVRVDRPLRIVQISDPHLGPFMPIARLRRICELAVAKDPDLILLTGDFLTMESQASPNYLDEAFAPLAALPGRVFACNGNHDHEAPHIVQHACRKHGISLLIDDEAVVETPAGTVQIVGFDYAFRRRKERMAALCKRYPRRDEHLRILLLHDPGAFRHLPEGEGDLVLSGHTHGGQLGLVSLGLPWTLLSVLTRMPDHGFWARGTDRLYVHRGTGHYGFPLRLGVPAEEGLLRVHWIRS
ncbi:MAG: metallophosphoesterase [Myxococcota bacterium]